MSASNRATETNNPYHWIEEASEQLWRDGERAISDGEAGLISDEAVRRLMTAAVATAIIWATRASAGWG